MYCQRAQAGDYDSTRLAIFRMDSSGQWLRVGGSVDAQAKLVRTAVDELERLGSLKIVPLPLATWRSAISTVSPALLPEIARAPARRFAADLSGPADVTVRVYNSAGKLARVIVRDEPMAPGRISLKWNRRMRINGRYPVGVYRGC